MRQKRRVVKPRVLAFAEYLDAVQRLHRLEAEEIAASVGVTASEVRRWRRGTHAPSLSTVENLTSRFGGDAKLVYLGIVLERFARQTGCSLEEAANLPFSRRRAVPVRKRRMADGDRRQMSFLPD